MAFEAGILSNASDHMLYPIPKSARNESVSVKYYICFVDEIDHLYVFIKIDNSKTPTMLYPQKSFKHCHSETLQKMIDT